MDDINAFVADPKNRALLQIVKSMRNGLVYGGKLRFAHTLVMQALFKRGTPISKRITAVLRMTRAHGGILAVYALCYRVLILLFESVHGESLPSHEFITGALSGLLVYGNWHSLFNHAITHQITLYCGARVVLALGNMAAHKLAKELKTTKPERVKLRKDIHQASWAVFASLTWGSVMYLHRYYPSFLQHGLESSMEFIYDDFKWNDVKSLLGI